MTSEIDIFQLDEAELQKFSSSTAQEPERIQYYERKFSNWISTINNLLNDDSDLKKESPEAGPKVELEYWRYRMQKITGWCE